MRSSIAQYLNEIVSLTIMALMCIAFVAGQADARPKPPSEEPVEARQTVASKAPSVVRPLEDRLLVLNWPKIELDLDLRFRHPGE
jgi:hypothetical protein